MPSDMSEAEGFKYLNNMFYRGQKVVYITGISMPKDTICTIRDMFHFPCGCTTFDIGVCGITGDLQCSDHGTFCGVVSACEHFDSNSFRPLLTDSIEWAEEQIKRIEKTIDIDIEELILN